jgi:hypothetical protein
VAPPKCDHDPQRLHAALPGAVDRRDSDILCDSEAGVGKVSVARDFVREMVGDVRVHRRACDALGRRADIAAVELGTATASLGSAR